MSAYELNIYRLVTKLPVNPQAELELVFVVIDDSPVVDCDIFAFMTVEKLFYHCPETLPFSFKLGTGRLRVIGL